MKTTILNTLRNYYGHLKDKVVEQDATENLQPIFTKYQSARDVGRNEQGKVTREHSTGGITSTSTIN
jgi:hypothetical protein